MHVALRRQIYGKELLKRILTFKYPKKAQNNLVTKRMRVYVNENKWNHKSKGKANKQSN